MASVGKWITGGLGWAFFGPIGGILGFVVGSLFDQGFSVQSGTHYQTGQQTTQGGYIMSLLVLVSAVMKADGKVLKSELDYTKDFFIRSFGLETAGEAIKVLRDLLNQNVPVTEVCQQIRQNMDHPSRITVGSFSFRDCSCRRTDS